jgi:transcriptional regulator with XRE-family HTH domain
MSSKEKAPKILNPLLVQMGKELRKARHENKLTLEDVVMKTGISIKHLSNSENGQHDMRFTTLVRLLDMYDMDLFIDKK